MLARVRASAAPTAADDLPLRAAVAGAGAYPLAVLTALNFVDELDRAVVAVFAPNIRRFFDISNGALGAIVGIQVFVVILASVPIGYLGTRTNRSRLLKVSAAVWGAFSAVTALAVALPLFVLARLGTGVGKAAVEPVGRSLLSDVYPRRAWTRVFAIHSAANPAGNVLGPLLAGAIGLAVAGDGAWRLAFPILAVPTFVALAVSRPLRDPEPVDEATAAVGADLPLGQAVTRLLSIPTFYRQLVGIGILGFGLVGAATFTSVLYEEEFGVGEGGRGAIIAFLATGSFVGLTLGARYGERVFQASPALAVTVVAGGIAGYAVITAVSVLLPVLWLCVAGQWVALAFAGAGTSPLASILSAISPPRLRPLAFSLLGLFVALFGGVLGGFVVGTLADTVGIRLALATLGPVGVLGGVLFARGASTIDGDVAAMETEAREEVEAQARRARGDTELALRVRGLDFHYGSLQVLFGVDLDVEEGSIVALLGTNGAGKSTVLRAVTGLDLPTRGSIRAFGDDVTYADAATRVRKGLVQVPGGRGTFPSLSVIENLRMGAFTYRKDKVAIDAGVDEVFGFFPDLAGRVNQQAGTLSGGQQQMLALGRAFLGRPRLLMIDELSLGLAPIVVEQLLGICRAMNARGTTLVLVEQSLNVALSVADTAYFMERGEVRFGGPASQLLERGDLLRSVFLEGAGSDLGGGR